MVRGSWCSEIRQGGWLQALPETEAISTQVDSVWHERDKEVSSEATVAIC